MRRPCTKHNSHQQSATPPENAAYDPELARTAAASTATRFGDPAPVLAAVGDAGLEGVECRELPVAFTMKAEQYWSVAGSALLWGM